MKRYGLIAIAMMVMGCGVGEVADPEAPTRAVSASSETAKLTGVVAWEAYHKRLIGTRADGSLALDMRVLSDQRLAIEVPEKVVTSLKGGRLEGLSEKTMGLVAAFISDDGTDGLPEGAVALIETGPILGGNGNSCPEGCALALARACNGIVVPPSCYGVEPWICCNLAYVRCCL